jgi:hypothetical protein
MPWKECHAVDERLRFIARLLDGEKMAALCTEFGISRKTGYKIYDRGLVEAAQQALAGGHRDGTALEPNRGSMASRIRTRAPGRRSRTRRASLAWNARRNWRTRRCYLWYRHPFGQSQRP